MEEERSPDSSPDRIGIRMTYQSGDDKQAQILRYTQNDKKRVSE